VWISLEGLKSHVAQKKNEVEIPNNNLI
jgi:hypothetical protein